ncbi:MAG: ornithine cyclodeaminase [Burkholderiales bacterium]|nr:ornithine cyclodeaminase [Burkholderiales bacterium]
MTTLLTTHDVAAIVAAHGLPEVLRRMEAAITADFRRWSEFDKVPRLASHSSVGVIELMPVADAEHYAFKYVNGHPGNARHGLPTVMAFGVIADVATGLPRLLGELTLTTAMRTAATSVMAARALARPDARTMALIGNGAQSEFQAIAFAHLLGIRRLRLYDVDATATAKLMRNLRGQPDLEIVSCASVAEAVRGADIVTTVTADKRRAAVLLPAMVEPGMHLNAVGGDCPGKTEVHPEVLQRASVFVEYEPQSRIEGDVQQMAADFPVTELWRVLSGAAPGRVAADAVTMFDSVGFALEDYAALRLMGELAAGLGLGQQVDLIPTLRDPRDLYAELLPAPVLRQLRRA